MAESLVIPLSGLNDKYKKDKRIGLLFIFLGLFIMAGTFYLNYKSGVYEQDAQTYRAVIPLFFLLLCNYGYGLYKKNSLEENLLQRLQDKSFVLNEAGMSGPIALLEGPSRDKLRDKMMASFLVSWPEIEFFIVEPVRKSGKSLSPPYFKITLKDKKPDYSFALFVLRKFFPDREEQVIEFVKNKLGEDKIILNDALQ